MGTSMSKCDPSKMPNYFVEEPVVSKLICGLLERSLRNVVGYHNKKRKKHLQFVTFYSEFFSKLDDIEPEHCSLSEFIGHDLESRTVFLARLLGLIVRLFQTGVAKARNRLDMGTKREIKFFWKEYKNVKLECYGTIGEALFHAMMTCDEMYAEYITQAWINGYSFFLKHFVPIAYQLTRKERNGTLKYNLNGGAFSHESQMMDEGETFEDIARKESVRLKNDESVDYDGVPLPVTHEDDVCLNSISAEIQKKLGVPSGSPSKRVSELKIRIPTRKRQTSQENTRKRRFSSIFRQKYFGKSTLNKTLREALEPINNPELKISRSWHATPVHSRHSTPTIGLESPLVHRSRERAFTLPEHMDTGCFDEEREITSPQTVRLNSRRKSLIFERRRSCPDVMSIPFVE